MRGQKLPRRSGRQTQKLPVLQQRPRSLPAGAAVCRPAVTVGFCLGPRWLDASRAAAPVDGPGLQPDLRPVEHLWSLHQVIYRM